MNNLGFTSPAELSELVRLRSIPKVMNWAGNMTKRAGFEYFAYTQIRLQHLTKPQRELRGVLPTEWLQKYQDKQYLAIDPLYDKAAHAMEPILWEDHIYAEHPEIRSLNKAHGMGGGISNAVRTCDASTIGVVSVIKNGWSFTQQDKIDLAKLSPWLGWLSQTVHSKVQQLSNTLPTFTDKELEIMRWTADGKSAIEIAHIVGITDRAVTFCISKVIAQLGVQNKTAAAVRLAMMGLLY